MTHLAEFDGIFILALSFISHLFLHRIAKLKKQTLQKFKVHPIKAV